MSKEIVTIGNPNLADETMYCPGCGIQIEYENWPPNYCPQCGTDINVSRRIEENP